MMKTIIPEFAIIGHPNEGKSSIVSTLSEDDSVRVSDYPGETTQCRIFPVVIDGKEIIRFTDTPGFQMPGKTLRWFREYSGPEERSVSEFINENKEDKRFSDECELLSPVNRGAGIIYIADGSRPVRKNDVSEMEILKLTGRPGLAIINCKSDDTQYIDEWKLALGNCFTSVTVFNAHKATWSERIALLETLKQVDDSWTIPVGEVISAFRQEWNRRNTRTAELICSLIEQTITHKVTGKCSIKSQKGNEKKRLEKQWNRDIELFEKETHQSIRKLFKHNIFNIELPPDSIVSKDLFDSGTWRVLGLSKAQLAAAAATCGSAAVAAVDLALAGHSFGLFALAGGIVGAGSVLLGADKIAKTRIIGKRLGGYTLTVGPVKNIQLMYILIDRALIVYSHVINWAHGNRETPSALNEASLSSGSRSYTTRWNSDTKRLFSRMYSELVSQDAERINSSMKKAVHTIRKSLDSIQK